MRIWHWQLIDVLPWEQLVSQWREVSSVVGSIQLKGTPNHVLVNEVLNYDYDHLISYAYYVRSEMTRRGYKPNWQLIVKEDLFPNWHNERYLKQCYYNLEEKYDRGGIKEEDFNKICFKLTVKYDSIF